MTALAFGLLHQNLFQFFYAFGVGLIFGYVYMRTGKIRYSVILHTVINFIGSVIAPFVLKILDIERLANFNFNTTTEELTAFILDFLPGLIVYLLYTTILSGITIAGIVFLIIELTRLKWQHSELQLPKGTVFKTVYLNAGVICYILVCGAFIVLSLF